MTNPFYAGVPSGDYPGLAAINKAAIKGTHFRTLYSPGDKSYQNIEESSPSFLVPSIMLALPKSSPHFPNHILKPSIVRGSFEQNLIGIDKNHQSIYANGLGLGKAHQLSNTVSTGIQVESPHSELEAFKISQKLQSPINLKDLFDLRSKDNAF